MKSKQTPLVFVRGLFCPVLLLGPLLLSRTAKAQTETVEPLVPPVESMSQLHMTNSFQVFPTGVPATPPAQYEPFRWDQFVVRPHFDYQYMDAIGLLAAPSNHVNSTVQTISPGILVDMGPHWALDYTLTLGLYSNTNFGTEVDHSVTLTGQTTYNGWNLGFVQSVLMSQSALIETAEQTSQQNYNTTVTGQHQDNQYISEDLAVYQNIQNTAGGFENMRTWSTLDWLNYQPQSRFLVGIGPGLGYNNADFGPDAVFEELQAQMSWRMTDRLSVQASAGVNETEFLGGQGASDLFSPIYGGTIQFQPFASTQLSVFANRTVAPSLFVGQYSESTSYGASISQRLLRQFYVTLGGTYNNQSYVASATDVSATRIDKYYALTARLSHSFLKRGSVAVFFQYGKDNSNLPGYSFTTTQYGADVNYSF